MKAICITGLLAIHTIALHAQSPPVNFTGWYGYEGYHPFHEGKAWGLFAEGYIKRNDVIIEEMQYFIRVGINYTLTTGNRITGGFAYQYTTPYDEASEPYNWPDYRVWEQYMIRKPTAKGMWVHRFRLEQRWLGRKDEPGEAGFDEYEFENTLRYMIRKTFVFNENLYGILNDEIHLRTLTTEPDRILDQNRIYAGIGINLNKNKWWRIEVGYMYQLVFNSSPDVNERKRTNHTFRITLVSDAPFKE